VSSFWAVSISPFVFEGDDTSVHFAHINLSITIGITGGSNGIVVIVFDSIGRINLSIGIGIPFVEGFFDDFPKGITFPNVVTWVLRFSTMGFEF